MPPALCRLPLLEQVLAGSCGSLETGGGGKELPAPPGSASGVLGALLGWHAQQPEHVLAYMHSLPAAPTAHMAGAGYGHRAALCLGDWGNLTHPTDQGLGRAGEKVLC